MTDPAAVAFAVPFRVSAVHLDLTYVVGGTIIDLGRQWTSAAGVPVITNGAPFTNVEVPLSPQADAPACPSPAPSESPAAESTTPEVPASTTP